MNQILRKPTIDELATGKVGNVQRVLDTVCNEWDRPVRVMDFDHTPSMAEMIMKYGEPFLNVLKENRKMKNLHAQAKRGYFLRGNTFRARYIAEIPVEISGNPRNPLYWQYFSPKMDAHERRKYLYLFLRKYDMAFSVVDKL